MILIVTSNTDMIKKNVYVPLMQEEALGKWERTRLASADKSRARV
jgi:hypothetical protein